MIIALSGGGTGGHVYPALSIAAALRAELEGSENLEIVYLGSRSRADMELVEREGIRFKSLASGPIRGRNPLEFFLNSGRMGYGFWQARRFLRKNNPQAILSTGGYASFPVVLAAASLKVPQVVYLPDVYPGWAVRVSARLAQRAAVSSEKSLGRLPKGKTTVTGYPVRPQFWLARRAEGRRRLGLNPEEKVLFVSGASQGSRHLNETVATNLLGLLELCEVVHLSGRAHEAKLTELKEGLPTESRSRYHLYGYLHDELPWAMAAADLAVCRAGASVMGELPAVGLPAVLVPYPYAGGHQRLNARHLEEKGAAIILEDRNLQREFLPLIGSLLNDSERLTKMREASQALARPEAATRIARLLLEVARNNGR